jgi:4a-hydroxytetrahydrobiopterin dehydratase
MIMPERKKLSPAEIQSGLPKLAGWQLKDDKLHKTFQFDTFADAFAFMTKIALAAEKLDHHPDWCNVYNKVTVDLSTHDLGGISGYDFELARIMNECQ